MKDYSGPQDPQNADETLEKPSSSTLGDVSIEMLMDVPVSLTVELGRKQMTIKHLLELSPGSVVAFDQSVTDPMDIRVNGVLVGRGEVVSANGKLGLRLTEVVSPKAKFD
mgnify:CR=1 FL=1